MVVVYCWLGMEAETDKREGKERVKEKCGALGWVIFFIWVLCFCGGLQYCYIVLLGHVATPLKRLRKHIKSFAKL